MAIQKRMKALPVGASLREGDHLLGEQNDVRKLFPYSLVAQTVGVYDVTSYGAQGDGVTDDTTAIQDAIDAAAVTGGVVSVPAGVYIISTTLIIKEFVGLELSPNAQLRTNIDISVVRLAYSHSYLEGGWIFAAAPEGSYTSGAVLVNVASDEGEIFNRYCQKQGVYHTRISRATHKYGGVGLHLLTTPETAEDNATVQWLTFVGLSIQSFDEGIRLDADVNGTETSYINGNNFSDILMEDVKINLRLKRSGDATPVIAGNNFLNFQIQTDANEVDHVVLIDDHTSGRVRRNNFVNFSVYDFAGNGGTVAIEIPDDAEVKQNFFVGLQGVTEDEIDVNREHERTLVVSPGFLQPVVISGQYTALETASDYPGVLKGIVGASSDGFAYSNGTEWALFGQGKLAKYYDEDKVFAIEELVRGILYRTTTSNPGVDRTWDISAAEWGCELWMLNTMTGGDLVKIDPGTGNRFYDPFNASQSSAGYTLNLDLQAQVIIRAVDAGNWAILFQKGTITYTAP